MIQEKHMRELYGRTAAQYGKNPQAEQAECELKAWTDVLGSNSYSDLDAALRRWSGNTAIEFSGRMAGARMPTAAELKASIQNFDRSQSDRFQPCSKCENGWVRVPDGKTLGGAQIDERRPAVRRCECFARWALFKNGSVIPGKPELVAGR